MGPFYTLVFSNNKRFRIARHILFWFCWISFYAFVQTYRMYELKDIPFWSNYLIAWGEMLIQIPIDIFFCYSVIYFLLPVFFLKSRHLAFVLWWIVLVFVSAALQHIYYYGVVTLYTRSMGWPVLESKVSLFLGALSIVGSLNTEGGFAAAIKLGKLFFIQQKETELLSREIKAMATPFEKDETITSQPTFLFNVLNRLYSLVRQEKIDATETINKINKLILYAGYDAKKTMLPLSGELEALKEYIDLEKLSYNYFIEVRYNVEGSPLNKQIVPYVLIPLVETSFASLDSRNTDGPWLAVDILIQDNTFTGRFISSKPSDTSTLLGNKNINVINIEKRLQLLYPGGYSLKKVIEPDKLSITLQIDLSKRLGV